LEDLSSEYSDLAKSLNVLVLEACSNYSCFLNCCHWCFCFDMETQKFLNFSAAIVQTFMLKSLLWQQFELFQSDSEPNWCNTLSPGFCHVSQGICKRCFRLKNSPSSRAHQSILVCLKLQPRTSQPTTHTRISYF